jgi:hypothetical protein
MDCIIFYQPSRDSTAPASGTKVIPSPLPSSKSWMAAPCVEQSSNARDGIEVVDLTGLDWGHPDPKRATTCQHDAGDATDTKAGSYVNGFTSGGSQGEAVGLRLRFLPYEFTHMAFQISRSS